MFSEIIDEYIHDCQFHCAADAHENHKIKLLQLMQDNDCRELLSNPVDVVKMGNFITYVVTMQQLDLLRACLDNGVNVNIENGSGSTALIMASWDGHTEVVQMLLERNANINHQDNIGWTPLMCSSVKGYSRIVELLLSHGANVDLENNDGKTVFDLRSKHKEVKDLLKNHTATGGAKYILK